MTLITWITLMQHMHTMGLSQTTPCTLSFPRLHPLLPQTLPYTLSPYTLSFPRLSPTPSPPTPFPSPLPLHLRVHCARLTTISKPISGEWKWVRKPFNSASASVQASQAYTTVFPCPCSTLTLPVSCVSGRLAVYLHWRVIHNKSVKRILAGKAVKH